MAEPTLRSLESRISKLEKKLDKELDRLIADGDKIEIRKSCSAGKKSEPAKRKRTGVKAERFGKLGS